MMVAFWRLVADCAGPSLLLPAISYHLGSDSIYCPPPLYKHVVLGSLFVFTWRGNYLAERCDIYNPCKYQMLNLANCVRGQGVGINTWAFSIVVKGIIFKPIMEINPVLLPNINPYILLIVYLWKALTLLNIAHLAHWYF